MVLRLPDSWSNWNFEMLVFEEKGKPEYPEKNLSEQRREPTTNSTHIWRQPYWLSLCFVKKCLLQFSSKSQLIIFFLRNSRVILELAKYLPPKLMCCLHWTFTDQLAAALCWFINWIRWINVFPIPGWCWQGCAGSCFSF